MSDSDESAENFEDAVEDAVEDALPWNPAELEIVILDPLDLTPSVAQPAVDKAPHSTNERTMSVKVAHVKNEDGHHVVVGNGGKLTRCKDEPIRTPGAVQAFGVLVVLEQQSDALVVRQVSEVSGSVQMDLYSSSRTRLKSSDLRQNTFSLSSASRTLSQMLKPTFSGTTYKLSLILTLSKTLNRILRTFFSFQAGKKIKINTGPVGVQRIVHV